MGTRKMSADTMRRGGRPRQEGAPVPGFRWRRRWLVYRWCASRGAAETGAGSVRRTDQAAHTRGEDPACEAITCRRAAFKAFTSSPSTYQFDRNVFMKCLVSSSPTSQELSTTA